MCGVQLKDRKISTDFMFMLGYSETIDQLAMANSVRWHGHVLRREDGHVLRRALDVEVDCEMKNVSVYPRCYFPVFQHVLHIKQLLHVKVRVTVLCVATVFCWLVNIIAPCTVVYALSISPPRLSVHWSVVKRDHHVVLSVC